jgi:hypothetical protein
MEKLLLKPEKETIKFLATLQKAVELYQSTFNEPATPLNIHKRVRKYEEERINTDGDR